MIYIDPPYGIKYDSNFQQRVNSTKNEEKDRADDVLTIKAFRDTWALGIHSYLSYLQERLYLCRELLATAGIDFPSNGRRKCAPSRARCSMKCSERNNFVAEIIFYKTSGKGGAGLDSVYDRLLVVREGQAEDARSGRYTCRGQLYTLQEQYTLVELRMEKSAGLRMRKTSGPSHFPQGARHFMPDHLSSQGETEGRGRSHSSTRGQLLVYRPTHTGRPLEGRKRLAAKRPPYSDRQEAQYRRYADDFPWHLYTNVWDGHRREWVWLRKLYAVQTSPEGDRALHPDDHGARRSGVRSDLRFGYDCYVRGIDRSPVDHLRHLTGGSERHAATTRVRRIGPHYRTRNGKVSGNFLYKRVPHITLKSLAYDLEPEVVDLADQPEVDRRRLRVCGPFEVDSLGRYSVEDWKGYVLTRRGGGDRRAWKA